MNCTVHARKDGCEVWVGNQVMARAQATATKTTGLPLDKVVVHNHLIGGGFDRLIAQGLADLVAFGRPYIVIPTWSSASRPARRSPRSTGRPFLRPDPRAIPITRLSSQPTSEPHAIRERQETFHVQDHTGAEQGARSRNRVRR